jgi:hypothetical protein
MTINGTDFRIQQKGAARKGNLFGSHKYAGKSALRYELGVDILVGNSVWVEGPYPAGAWNDIIFLNIVLSHCLEPGDKDCSPAENLGMQGEVRSRHEMLNGHLKHWGILEKVYRHDVARDGFFTCVQ